ncbi:MAG: MotA/TolQ/ExbB proton channel family protein [Planctomycetales bacterium]|nr:MotA/TolQ/ExbB proton channel family protein [Planctomycetales bacterium]
MKDSKSRCCLFSRLTVLLVTSLALTLGAIGSPAAWGQADSDLDAEAGLNQPQTVGGGQPAAAGGANNQAAAPSDAGDDDAPKPPTNLLAWTFQALTIYYTVIFFALSITLLTLVVMNLIAARRDNICPPDLIEGVEQQLAEGNPQAAAELIRSDDSFLGQVVAAGLSKIDRGFSHAVEAMQEVGEEETMKMEHNLSYMALIGNISPMIGLFGTVQGMIQAFRTIATSGSSPKPTVLAMDISTALFTTLAGLAIAIPAIAVYNILRNRVQRLTLQVGVTSEELIERFIK